MTETSDAIHQLCLMAYEALGAHDLDQAARLLDLALAAMNGATVPERDRATAQRSRGVVHVMMGEHPSALARCEPCEAASPAAATRRDRPRSR